MLTTILDRKYRYPRLWSNKALRQIAPYFKGDVINVSGWLDEDKEGNFYSNYFKSAISYSVSNFGGYRGVSDKTAFHIDLEAVLPCEMENRFDVVFNHTTLEHVFDVFAAVRNLCKMSKDIVIVVVPFIQEQHAHDNFSDYWRFTPLGIKALFQANGMDVVLLCSTPGHHSSIYHLVVATRFFEKWSGVFDKLDLKENDGATFFSNPIKSFLKGILRDIRK